MTGGQSTADLIIFHEVSMSPSRCPTLVLLSLLLVMSLASAGPKVAAGPDARPAPLSAQELEDRAFAAINHEREAQGLRPLVRAADLAAIARAHSRDMLARGYFDHRSPEGADLRVRFARSGIHRWQHIAENIAYNLGYQDPVTVAVEGWMHSPGHRRNILDKRLVESGIGVARDAAGRTYFTQVFAAREQSVVARAW
jgi:uncharacterized protein YkwD